MQSYLIAFVVSLFYSLFLQQLQVNLFVYIKTLVFVKYLKPQQQVLLGMIHGYHLLIYNQTVLLPLGTFLTAAAVVSFFVAPIVLQWYIAFLGF
mgnify:CR=1 FL=1